MTDRIISILLDSFWQILLPGLVTTIPLTLVSFFFGIIIALITALVQVAEIRVLKRLAGIYVWIIRGTPLLVQLYVIFYGLPTFGILLDAFPAAVIAFSINVGAYCSETIRAAILSIPKGQMEAGYCSGLNYIQIMGRIVLPQALKVAFPSLFNSFIGLTKDTSLAANITVLEMFMATQRIAARTYEPFALYCEVGLIYLMMCTILTRLQRFGERKLK
ncbi:MAG: amino acid ABC transporter permease [Lachnospiraceae bacterium]|nr:amino acid ABC transporter permease [Lachnospiraceae bacterium]